MRLSLRYFLYVDKRNILKEPIGTSIKIIPEQPEEENTTSRLLKSPNPLARVSQILFQQRDEFRPQISIQKRLHNAKRCRTKKKMRATKLGK